MVVLSPDTQMTLDDQALASRNSAEFRAYVDEMWRRLRVFSKRSAAIPAQERGSFEWLSAAGRFWRQAREHASLSRADVAEQLGVSINHLRFLELGLVSPTELSEPRLRDYARAVGDPDLYNQFRDQFEP